MPREKKRLSPARQVARILVWTTLAFVLFLRFAFSPERAPRNRPWQGQWPPQRSFGRPTQVGPPVSPVPTNLWRIHIELTSKDVTTLRASFGNGRGGARQERPEVIAMVREGGQTYTNVGIHLKGSVGSFRFFDDKPAFTLNFSKHAEGQRFHGYSKISLNNSVQDSSYLEEAISRELFDAAGVPVPRADHATLVIHEGQNERDLGLYVLTEGFGKQFLKRYFKDVRGNLYDGGFVQDIDSNLDTNSGDHPEDHSDLRRLRDAARERNYARRWEKLNQILDMDRFISFLAMEIMTCHGDGYAMNRNNFRVFHNLESDRMIFMPHGMDQMFGRFRFPVNGPINPAELNTRGLVATAVLKSPQGGKLFLERIAQLRTNVFLEEKLTSRVREIADRIRPTLAAYDPGSVRRFNSQVEGLCRRITARAESISEKLASGSPLDLEETESSLEPVRFGEDGVARLTGWRRQVTQEANGLRFDKQEQDGKKCLHITAGRGASAASWRTQVVLEPGRYRFEGRVRTRGVNSGGVCLRISGSQIRLQNIGDNAWKTLSFRIPIAEPSQDVVLVCELRASRGEAWFDEESLRLIRE